VILLAGLQGSGKTTTGRSSPGCSQASTRRSRFSPPADVYRPAAIEQLEVLARQIGVDFFPAMLSEAGSHRSRRSGSREKALPRRAPRRYRGAPGDRRADDAEIAELHAALKPVETLFVVEQCRARLGQGRKAFGDALPLTGIVLTKLDGDARGGAALSCGRSPESRSVRRREREAPTAWSSFIPRGWPRASSAWHVLSLVEEARKTVDVEEAKNSPRS